MFEFIRTYQLDIMLLLCGACGMMAVLLLITRFLDARRKWALFLMEIVAFFLLWFDRLAYIYAAQPGPKAYVMVRLSNFMVFAFTIIVVTLFLPFSFGLLMVLLYSCSGLNLSFFSYLFRQSVLL